MDLKKFTSVSVQIVGPTTPTPSARVVVSFLDPATELEPAWAEIKAEVMAHPQLADLVFASETVSGTISPARGLTATVMLKQPPKPAAAPVTPAPTKLPA